MSEPRSSGAGSHALVARLALMALLGVHPAAVLEAQDWPQLLGPNRDGVYDGAPLGVKPRLSWRRDVGAGFAAPVVVGERLILFHRVENRERVEALRAATGEPQWAHEYETTYRDDFGFDEGPRATPVVRSGRVFTFGAEGRLHALALETGEPLWNVDTREAFRPEKGWFGVASSPLVMGERVLVNVGGRDGAGIVAFDVKTGAVSWRATDHDASYSSPTVWDGDAVFLTREGLVVVSAETGAVRHQRQWRSRSRASVNAATPLVDDEIVFVSASYGTGAAALARSDGSTLEELWSSDEVLSGHYATPVLREGALYGFHGRQEYGPALRAVDLRTGRVHWTEDRFMAGTISLAGDRLYIIRESGELVVAEATTEAFRPLHREALLPGVVRAYPAFAAGRLYVRNGDTLAAFDLLEP